VLVVVASQRDRIAAQTVAHWGTDKACLLTSGDLSRAGWRYRPGAASRSVAVVGGRRVRAADIEGVLVRLPYIAVEELAHIVPGDRTYVAQEMTAFLTAWLTELRCPVVNRPSAECLAGPGWGYEQWRQVAASVGLAVGPRRIRIVAGDAREPRPTRSHVRVTVVGGRGLDAAPDCAVDQALRLADAAGMALLEVHFARGAGGLRFAGANPWPDTSRPLVGDALREYVRAA
jgi:hypothetical protein